MKPSTSRALCLLREAGANGVTTADFAQAYIARFGARLAELRDLGAVIDVERLPGNQCRYVLTREPELPVTALAAVGPAGAHRSAPTRPEDAVGGAGAAASLFGDDVGRRPANAASQDWDAA